VCCLLNCRRVGSTTNVSSQYRSYLVQTFSSFSKQLHVSLSPRFGVFLEQVKGSRPDELPHDVMQTIEQSAHVAQRNDCCGVNRGLLVL
jgi:hypothetical protein